MAAVRLDGELTAKLPFAGLWPSETRAPTAEAFDLKAEVKANVEDMQLTNLSLAFEQGGTPQIIVGEIRAGWRKALDVEAKLTSRWLDLDRIAGVTAEAGPLDSILPFAQRLRDLMPAGGRAKASLAIEQANIGHDTATGVELILARAGQDLQIDRFRGAGESVGAGSPRASRAAHPRGRGTGRVFERAAGSGAAGEKTGPIAGAFPSAARGHPARGRLQQGAESVGRYL